ncbi:hypothetical protein TWF694_003928 [Orbilia ellipsospora]|uniref:Uncharacterized protein n=2 Tax=Orbilia ellipsospora TaxID=2528407 RepID=A0AAV9WWE8_9PEZI
MVSTASGRPESHHGNSSFFDDLSSDLDGYFTGPIDTTKSSKLPYFMRIRGSVLPGLILPMLFVTVWTVWITCVHQLVRPLNIDSLLLTVLGFLVGLALSFRSSTAYERYNDGRKCWGALTLNVRNMARLIWIHIREREGAEGEEDILAKLTAVNLLLAFCVSLKHKLRHQPEYDYKDLQGLISNIQTFAKSAHVDGDIPPRKALTTPQRISSYLGIPFFERSPSKRYKAYQKAGRLHGNLPLEIMTYLSSYLEMVVQGGQIPVPAYQSMAMAYMGGMMDSLTNCERISQTPLPVAYNIVISQITWLYVLFLPFQLVSKLNWVAIPGTLIGAYIILGFAAIGREIEDPFGDDVNDLNLDRYCDSIALELDMIMSVPPPKRADFITQDNNYVMFPNMNEGYNAWKGRGVEKIREELRKKPLRHVNPALAREIRQSELRDRDNAIEQKEREAEEREIAEQEATKKAEQLRQRQHQAQMPGDDPV